MKTSDLALAVQAAYFMQEPVFIWGPPGIGKSDIVAQAAKAIGQQLVKDKKLQKASDFQLIDFRMALRDPTDIKGFPMPDAETQTMKFFRDAELPTDGYGILFMDELVSAMPATQAAGMQLTLKNHKGEHAIGDYVLPKGFAIVAAGNRETDRGVVHRMPTPLANRFTHLDAEADADEWVNWALDHEVSPELIAFLRFRKQLLFKFDPKLDSKAFPTPRSWVRTEKIVSTELPDTIKFAMVKGTVGEGPGAEYWSFRKLVDKLPTIDQILMDPVGTPVPSEKEPSARYAVATLMGAHANAESFEALLTYAKRMQKELEVIFVRDSLRRNDKVKTSKVYTKWALENHEYFG